MPRTMTAVRSVRKRAPRGAVVRIAHDFNNILMSIVGHCDLLERGLIEPAEAARDIRAAAEAGGALAGQLLACGTRATPGARAPRDR